MTLMSRLRTRPNLRTTSNQWGWYWTRVHAWKSN